MLKRGLFNCKNLLIVLLITGLIIGLIIFYPKGVITSKVVDGDTGYGTPSTTPYEPPSPPSDGPPPPPTGPTIEELQAAYDQAWKEYLQADYNFDYEKKYGTPETLEQAEKDLWEAIDNLEEAERRLKEAEEAEESTPPIIIPPPPPEEETPTTAHEPTPPEEETPTTAHEPTPPEEETPPEDEEPEVFARITGQSGSCAATYTGNRCGYDNVITITINYKNLPSSKYYSSIILRGDGCNIIYNIGESSNTNNIRWREGEGENLKDTGSYDIMWVVLPGDIPSNCFGKTVNVTSVHLYSDPPHQNLVV